MPTSVRSLRDLLEAAYALADPGQLLLISAGASGSGLDRYRVPSDARLQYSTGGSRMSLNVRSAKAVIEASSEHAWDGALIRQMLAAELKRQPDIARFERRQLTDDEVRSYVESELQANPSTARSVLLRRLRDSGQACEQKRFGRLYGEVLGGLAS